VTAQDVYEQVRAAGVLAPGRPVVVLFSGGRDSVCLLDLAVRIVGPAAVRALHVNYGLRDAAVEDEAFCVELCARLVVTLDVRRPIRPTTGNLQAWARDERYGAAAALALRLGADVAAGHTASDQVETILYRLASSPSRRALSGMSLRSGTLIRPLLGVTRAQTTAYCQERGLGWREDASNDADAYARNRVRAGLLPALREIHPAAEDNILALAETLRAEGEVLDEIAARALGGRSTIQLAALRALSPGLRRIVVQRLADDARGALAPGLGARASEITSLSERGTVTLDLGHGLRAVVEYGALRIERQDVPRGATLEPVRLRIPGTVAFGEHEIHCALGPPELSPGVLDRDLLGDELIVRAWRPGDRMRPLGLTGSKSLQDLFTARRVPRERRRRLPVVEAAGEIVWVAGVATSERFKITAATRRAVHLNVGESSPRGPRP
jgi:tRNA(Ile)-lysidine synthase